MEPTNCVQIHSPDGDHLKPISNSKIHSPGASNTKIQELRTNEQKAEDEKVEQLLSNKEIRDILLDEDVRRFIDLLRSEPVQAQKWVTCHVRC